MTNKPSIKIKAKSVGISHDNRFTERILSVTVSNLGKISAELSSISIILSNGNKHLISSPKGRFNLPQKLGPGQEISIEFDGSGENDRYIGEKNAKIVFEDTSGNSYSAIIE